MIERLLQQIHHDNVQLKSFQHGQIFYGRITRLFPQQLAEVFIGKQKLIATLETPLEQNKSYWFQVQLTDGKIHLKVLTMDQGGVMGKQIHSPGDILTALQLPHSKEYLQLVRLFINEPLPLTKETLTGAMEWLRHQEESQEGLLTIKEVLLQRLPLTPAILSAYHSIRQGAPFHTLIKNVWMKLADDPQTPDVKSVMSRLTSLILHHNEHSNVQAIIHTIKKWLLGSESEQKAAYQLLQTIGFFPKSNDEQTILARIYKNILNLEGQKNTSPPFKHHLWEGVQRLLPMFQKADPLLQTQLLQQFAEKPELADDVLASILKEQEHPALVANNETASPYMGETDPTGHYIKAMLQVAWKTQVPFKNVKAGKETELDKLFWELLTDRPYMEPRMQMKMLEQMGTVQTINENGRNKTERSATVLLLESLQSDFYEIQNPVDWGNSAFVRRIFGELLQMLGLQFEYELKRIHAHDGYGSERVLGLLKPALLRYLQTPGVHGKKEAELLLHRLTGMQLLSREASPFQQLVMQIPIELHGKSTDITLQWNGKKTSSGQLDPDHCRIVFYLYLPYLKQTMIDVQVQDRTLHLSIFTETDRLKKISPPYEMVLKNNLAALNYKLSTVTFQPFKKKGATNLPLSPVAISELYKGVDLRV